MDADEFEASEIGRSPRFPAGWYIAPLFLIGVAMCIGAIAGIVILIGKAVL